MSKNTLLSELINYVSSNSSGNVTIAAPSSGLALDVTGTGRFTGLITSNTGFATNAQNGYTLKNDANSANLGGLVRKKYWFGGTDDSPVIFAETGYSLGFYVDGSTTKGLSLATTGAATFSSSVTSTGDIQSNGIYRDYQGEALIQTTTGAITQIGSLGAGTSRTISLLAGNSERMRITSGGNVNINTTSAYTSRLNVQAATANRPAIKAGYGAVAGNGYWILGDNYTNDESLSAIGIDYSSGALVIGSALAPSSTTSGAFISTQAQFGGYGSAIRLDTGGAIYFYNGTQNSVISAGSAKTASIAMTIFQNGSVGIGNFSPFSKLHVQDGTNTGTIAFGHQAYPALLYSDATTGEFRIDNRSSSSAGYITFYPNGQSSSIGSERMRITNTGVIDFSGNSAITNVNDKFTIGINGSSYVWMQSWSGRPITINPSGNNVLIATTSDVGGKLQVNGDIRAYGSFFRETGNITVNNGWTNVFTINTASQRTYLLQIIATNSEASLSYRYFGVIQGNPASSSYTAVSLASQTMEVQFSGATIQTRLTNSNQFNFNWSITQLL